MYGSPTMQKLPFLFIYSWGGKNVHKKDPKYRIPTT